MSFVYLGGRKGVFLGGGLVVGLPLLVVHSLALVIVLGRWLVLEPKEQAAAIEAQAVFAAHPGIVIGVAGSYGKTTMKETLKTVLSVKKKVAATPGNYNTPIGLKRFAASLEGDEDVLIVELGEYRRGDVWRLAQIAQPDLGVITGVNEQHMLRMGSIENAVATVFELADYLGDKPVYVNGESNFVEMRLNEYHRVYSVAGVDDWRASGTGTDLKGVSFTLKKGKKALKLHSGLLGLHQVGPLAAVAAIADELGLSPKNIEKGIAQTAPFARRFQPQVTQGITIIDDTYNGNPDGFRVAIDFLSDLKKVKRRIYVTPGIIELGPMSEEIHRAIGAYLAQSKIEKVVLVRNRVTEWLASGFEEAQGKADLQWIEDATEFQASIGDYAADGDVVFLQNSAREEYFYRQ